MRMTNGGTILDIKRWAKELKTKLAALYLALRRKDTPLPAKLLAGLTVAYALSPIDLIPDFIPILGYLDDVLLLPALIALCIRLIPKAVFAECLEQSRTMWTDGRPKKWYFAALPVLIWVIVLAAVAYNLLT